MAQVLRDKWEPVWNRPSPSNCNIDEYLSDYKKKIDTTEIVPLTKELVTAAIYASKDSSTGPDGIPFSVYRALNDIASSLLFLVLLHLSTGSKANRSFNYANLFFFPKDSSN